MPSPLPANLTDTDVAPAEAASRPQKRVTKQKRTAASPTNLILKRLVSLDSRIADLTENGHGGLPLQISETLNSQSQAIVQVADALKSLQCSLVNAVTDAIDDRLASETPPSAEDASAPSNESEREDDSQSDNELPESSWDAIRNAFLISHGETAASSTTASTSAGTSVSAVENGEDRDCDAADEPLAIEVNEPEAELPEFKSIEDPDSLTDDELRTAVIDQERTISMLVNRLQRKSRAAQPFTPDQLAELQDALPEDLQLQVTETLNALNNQLRYGELELSLERARVSRQASHLEATRERLDARASAMGLEITEDGALEGGSSTKRGSKGRNWLGAMGFGN